MQQAQAKLPILKKKKISLSRPFSSQGKRQPGKTENSYILTILFSQVLHEDWKSHTYLSQQRESWVPRLLVSPVCNGHSMLLILLVALTPWYQSSLKEEGGAAQGFQEGPGKRYSQQGSHKELIKILDPKEKLYNI